MNSEQKRKYKFLISYDGTAYGGWQVQPNSITIQQMIEKALFTLTGNSYRIIGSGRTDAGVHAKEQVAHVRTSEEWNIRKIHYGMNHLLPKDIRILHIEEAPLDFHARFSAKSKIYSYHITLHPFHSPFDMKYSYLMPGPTDIEKMIRASHYFIGKHDFRSYANEGHKGSAQRNSVRTIYSIDFSQTGYNLKITFHGDSFLYKMVRNIMGTLIEVGKNQLDLQQIPIIFEAKDRRRAGWAAPAKGLFLEKVLYNS